MLQFIDYKHKMCMNFIHLQTYSTEDLVDGENVFYFGRADYTPFTPFLSTSRMKSVIHNCVTLSVVNASKTSRENIYDGVGIMIRDCKSERFLCHGKL